LGDAGRRVGRVGHGKSDGMLHGRSLLCEEWFAEWWARRERLGVAGPSLGAGFVRAGALSDVYMTKVHSQHAHA